jgi:hypothetical protein
LSFFEEIIELKVTCRGCFKLNLKKNTNGPDAMLKTASFSSLLECVSAESYITSKLLCLVPLIFKLLPCSKAAKLDQITENPLVVKLKSSSFLGK